MSILKYFKDYVTYIIDFYSRKHCSIFDVSHMLQTRVYGKDRVAFMESITVADVLGLNDNSGSLTLFTTPKGGYIEFTPSHSAVIRSFPHFLPNFLHNFFHNF